jgi:putative RecB family exonuclease
MPTQKEGEKKRTIYSHSRLSTFEQCPFKFKLRYIDKIVPEIEQSIEAHLGHVVHEVLEWLYKEVKKDNIPTIDDVIIFYTELWKRDFNPGIVIVKKHMSQEDYFNKGIKFLLDYYTTNQPFDDNTLELEKQIYVKLDPEGDYLIQGFIDRLVHNLETGEYEIHDYKTAGSLPNKDKFDTDRQLALYALAIKELFGQDKKVCLTWHYLNFNKKICSYRTDEQLEQLRKDTINLIKEVEAATEFPTGKSVLCGWCEYKDMCPENGCSPPKQDKQIGLDKYPTISKYVKD